MAMMKVKTGDTVHVLTGKDRGKTGKIIQAMPAAGRVVVEGIGGTTKHLKSRRGAASTEKGQKVAFWAPVTVSNVALVCPKCAKPTRVGMKILADGKKVRQCKKCKEAV